MLNEITKFHDIGSSQDLTFFLKNIIGNKKVSRKEIFIISSNLNYEIGIKPEILIKFCLILGIIQEDSRGIYSIKSSALDKLNISNIYNLEPNYLASYILEFAIKKNIITQNLFTYDFNQNVYIFKKERFDTKFALFRNILFDLKFFLSSSNNNLFVNPIYEHKIEDFFSNLESGITPEELQRLLLKKSEAGLKAEQFVVEFEKKRLFGSTLSARVKQISLIDVSAGFDILSFNTPSSRTYDRFIEVKGYSKSISFYWSKNEIKKANQYLNNYYLYLVDLLKINDKQYTPIIIEKPSRLLNSEKWIKEVESYRITYNSITKA